MKAQRSKKMSKNHTTHNSTKALPTNGAGPVIYCSLLEGGTGNEVDIKRGLDKMAEKLGPNLIKLAAMPNARPGRGYMPQSGYVMTLKTSTPLMRGLFDVNTLFMGRVVVPLLDPANERTVAALEKMGVDTSDIAGRIASKLNVQELPDMLADAINAAYAMNAREANNETSSVTPLRPSESPCVVPTLTIIKKSFGFDVPHLLYEDHSQIKSVVDGSSLEALLEAAVESGKTVDEFFFSATMRSYYEAQLKFRSTVAHLMRDSILKVVLGKAVSEAEGLGQDTFGESRESDNHQVTNMMHTNVLNQDVFYSDCLKASAPMGALVSTGPFGELLWVNHRSNALNKLQTAGLEFAVPYKLNTTVERSFAIEAVVNQLDVMDNIRDDEILKVRTARAPVKWLDVDSQSVSSLGSAELVLARTPENGNGVSVDLLKNYRAGFDSRRSWSILERCGVTREIEINEPYQPIVTVLGQSNTLDLLELSQVKLAREEHEASMK